MHPLPEITATDIFITNFRIALFSSYSYVHPFPEIITNDYFQHNFRIALLLFLCMHSLLENITNSHFSSPILELLCSLPILHFFSRIITSGHNYSSPILELLCFSSYACTLFWRTSPTSIFHHQF